MKDRNWRCIRGSSCQCCFLRVCRRRSSGLTDTCMVRWNKRFESSRYPVIRAAHCCGTWTEMLRSTPRLAHRERSSVSKRRLKNRACALVEMEGCDGKELLGKQAPRGTVICASQVEYSRLPPSRWFRCCPFSIVLFCNPGGNPRAIAPARIKLLRSMRKDQDYLP